MSESSDATEAPAESPGRVRSRLQSVVMTAWAAVTGIAPHVLHHVGPLAGAAFFAGATGRVVFGIVALVLTVPVLLRVHRRSGTWRLPIALLTVFVIVWSVSTFVVGPRLYGEQANNPAVERPESPNDSTDEEHDGHHPDDKDANE